MASSASVAARLDFLHGVAPPETSFTSLPRSFHQHKPSAAKNCEQIEQHRDQPADAPSEIWPFRLPWPLAIMRPIAVCAILDDGRGSMPQRRTDRVAALRAEDSAKSFSPNAWAAARDGSASSAALAIRVRRRSFLIIQRAACKPITSVVAGV